MPPSTVLVAAPTCADYEPYFAQWWAAYEAFTYAQKSVYLVDTTPGTTAYYDTLVARGVPCVHAEPDPRPTGYLITGWKEMAKAAGSKTYVASIEADTICPPETLTFLVEIADRYNAAWVAHEYPDHNQNGGPICALGCTLVRVASLKAGITGGWGDVVPDGHSVDAYIYDTIRGVNGRCIELSNFLTIQHLP